MQRLSSLARDERGAVNVIMAFLLVPMVGFLALAVDVAAMWADKQQLQTGADAAALAIAQDCSLGPCDEAGNYQAAGMLTEANKNDRSVRVDGIQLDLAAGRVTVTAGTDRAHWFAPVLGIDSSTIRSDATVAWGVPTGGTAQIPLIFPRCQFDEPSLDVERTIKLSDNTCMGVSGNAVPGGFGWLASEDSQTCLVATAVGQVVYSDPGASATTGCVPADFAKVQGRTILLPVYEEYGGTGSNAWYKPSGYAAFTVTGYRFTGQYHWNAPCSGSERCIRGYFTKFVETSGDFQYKPGTPELATVVVELIE